MNLLEFIKELTVFADAYGDAQVEIEMSGGDQLVYGIQSGLSADTEEMTRIVRIIPGRLVADP